MTEHFGRFFSIPLHFEAILNVIGATSQALQIISEMQSQMTSQRRAIQKICFFELRDIFFFFFILTSLIFKPHNFLISCSF
jgi:hypothetical protein